MSMQSYDKPFFLSNLKIKSRNNEWLMWIEGKDSKTRRTTDQNTLQGCVKPVMDSERGYLISVDRRFKICSIIWRYLQLCKYFNEFLMLWLARSLCKPKIPGQKGDLTQSYDKSPYTDKKNPKSNVTTQNPQKTSITQRLRTDLGLQVWVTITTQLVWLNRFTGSQPSH